MQDLPELDNPAWHALRSAQGSLAETSPDGGAVRFPRDVSPFAAMQGQGAESWASLASLLGTGKAALLIRTGEIVPPEGWTELFFEVGTQYVAVEPDAPPDLETVILGAEDVADMMALTKLTEPGPFVARTHELGRYLGVRREGVLVAMAGERLRSETFSEISAVCVHPDARRQGLAGALTTVLAHRIRDQGKTAMLHVRDGNDAANALYQRIGFAERGSVTFAAYRCP